MTSKKLRKIFASLATVATSASATVLTFDSLTAHISDGRIGSKPTTGMTDSKTAWIPS